LEKGWSRGGRLNQPGKSYCGVLLRVRSISKKLKIGDTIKYISHKNKVIPF
jgi:hypothetical protein